MKLKQISIPIENSKTMAYKVTRVLEKKGAHIKALNLVDTGPTGELRILATDVAETRQILMQHHIPARVDDVVAVEIKKQSGQISEVFEKMMAADIRIRYAYPCSEIISGKAMMVLAGNDNEKMNQALEALSNKEKNNEDS